MRLILSFVVEPKKPKLGLYRFHPSLPLEMSFTISCFLVGDPHTFPVTIDGTMMVGEMKYKIKEKTTFCLTLDLVAIDKIP